MHITHSKQGGKSHRKTTKKMFGATKTKAVAEVMNNIAAEAKKIEINAVTQVLEKHIGRKLTFEDIPKVERVANEFGYVLVYDGKRLGDITRHNHTDHKSESNYKVTFTPYE